MGMMLDLFPMVRETLNNKVNMVRFGTYIPSGKLPNGDTMDNEEVVVAEIQDEFPEEEYRRGSRITAGPIIAIVIVVMIVTGLLFYLFSGDEVNDIVILAPDDVSTGDDERYGIEVEIHITGGLRSVDGTGKLDILLGGTPMHSRDVKISSDSGTAVIDYHDFVTENGVYDIKFSMGGRSASTQYTAKMVPHALNLSLQNQQIDDELRWVAVISPEFIYPNGEGDPMFFYSRDYDITTRITLPDSRVIEDTQSMWDWNRGNKTLTKVAIPLEDDLMGYYTIEASLVNSHVNEGSPYRELTSEPGSLRQYLNRAPEIDEILQPSRVRVDTEATFTLKATDPNTNSEIEYFTVTWDWGLNEDDDEDTISQDLEQFEVPEGTSTIRVKHTFREIGTHRVAITCADNGLVDEDDPQKHFQKYDMVVINVVVTLI